MEGKAQSVMSSYNAINGVPSAVNRWLLTDVLRRQWGFDGFVTDDLGAVQLLSRSGTTIRAIASRTIPSCRPRPQSRPGTTVTTRSSRTTSRKRCNAAC